MKLMRSSPISRRCRGFTNTRSCLLPGRFPKLPALRLGAVIGCVESVALVRRAMPPFPVNLAALVAAGAAISNSARMRGYVAEVKRLRVRVAKELRELGVKTYPSAGNFLLADFGATGPALFRKLE